MTASAQRFETALYGPRGKPKLRVVQPDAAYCPGCGTELPPPGKRRGRPRRWCSDRCRKITLYGVACVDCGTVRYTGGQNDGRHLRCRDCHIRHLKQHPELRPHSSTLKWTDADMLAAIRATAQDGLVSGVRYEKAAQKAKGAIPARITIIFRFGLWSEAVKQAGCQMERNGHGGPYQSRMPAASLLLAVEDCWSDLGHAPTMPEYDDWALRHGMPSGQTVRNRFGSWRDALKVAGKAFRR